MFKQNLRNILCFSIIVLLQINVIWADTSKNGFPKDPRIINGTEANVNATRHQVSIRNRLIDSLSFGNGHGCGGSLISENVVLTAAHCFINSAKGDGSFSFKEDFVVVMGNLDRFDYNNNTLIFDIMQIITWADYFNFATLADDILLLVLKGTVPAKHPTARPIILNEGPIPNNIMCQATGWGITENKRRAENLRTVDVPFIDFNDCSKKTQYGTGVREGMLCAGYLEGEKDACTADSGGPLTCKGIQAGVVSWGNGCAQKLYPGVYTDVAYYKKWILETVSHRNGTLPKFASIPGGVTNSTCSIFLISLILIFNFLYSQIK